MKTTATIVGGFPGEDGGRRAIAEEAERDQDTGVVIDVKGGGGNLHGDDGNGVGRVRGEVSVRGAEGGDGRAAAEADEIAEVGVGAKAEAFRDVARGAGAEVAGAGAEEKGIEMRGGEAGFIQGFGEGFGGEGGGVRLEGAVQRLRVLPKYGGEIGSGELAVADAGAAVCEDFFQQGNGAGLERAEVRVGLESQPGFRLGEAVRRVGGGEGM